MSSYDPQTKFHLADDGHKLLTINGAGFLARNISTIGIRKSRRKRTIKTYCQRLDPRLASPQHRRPGTGALTPPLLQFSSHSGTQANCDLFPFQTQNQARFQIRRSSKSRQADLLTVRTLGRFHQDRPLPRRTPTSEAPRSIKVRGHPPLIQKAYHHPFRSGSPPPLIYRDSRKPDAQAVADRCLPRLMSHPTLRQIRSSGKITNDQSFRTPTRPAEWRSMFANSSSKIALPRAPTQTPLISVLLTPSIPHLAPCRARPVPRGSFPMKGLARLRRRQL